jgi:hypothetical protein
MSKPALYLATFGLALGLLSVVAAQPERARFKYNPHGRPNPMVPLIVPTATPTSMATSTPTPTPTGYIVPGGPQPTATPTPFIPPPFALKAIIFVPGRSVAMIDGGLIEEGDTFSDAGIRLKKIRKDRVVLSYKGHTWTELIPDEWLDQGKSGEKTGKQSTNLKIDTLAPLPGK